MERYRRTASSGFIFAVSLFYFIYALFFIESHRVRGVPDSGFVPRIVGFFLVLLSGILLVRSIRSDRSEKKEDQEGTKGKEMLNVFGTAALLLIYILLIEPLGFLLATVFYLLAQFAYLSEPSKLRQPKTLAVYAVIAVAVSAGVYYLFLKVFHLILPAGILW